VYIGQLLPIAFSIQFLLSFFSPSPSEGEKKESKAQNEQRRPFSCAFQWDHIAARLK